MDPFETACQELIHQAQRNPLAAWDPTHALPWSDPDFSARMLRLHLDPCTTSASRPPAAIAMQLDWLESRLRPGPVLDLCCGPGLYGLELARRGRRTVGLDMAPAAVAWANERAREESLDATFLAADLAEGLPPAALSGSEPLAAVTCWFGDIHAFPRHRARPLLQAACAALAPGGLLVLEMQPWEDFEHEDELTAVHSGPGPLCDEDHFWVQRHRWDEGAATEVHGHWILARESATLTRYVQYHQAWHKDRLHKLLSDCGLEDPVWHDPIVGLDAGFEFPVLVARRAAAGGGP